MGNADAAFPPGNILFLVFEYIYIALIVMCFVLFIPSVICSRSFQLHGKSSSGVKVFIPGYSSFLRSPHGLHAVLLSLVDHQGD